MKTYRIQIRDAVFEAIRDGTPITVYPTRDWPTETGIIQSGIALVYSLSEGKEGVRSGQLEFVTKATIEVLVRVARGGPETAGRMIDEMAEQICAAVICNVRPGLYGIRYAPNVDTDIRFGSEGEMAGVAQAKIDFTFEFLERYQPGGVPLRSITNRSQGDFGSFEVSLPQ